MLSNSSSENMNIPMRSNLGDIYGNRSHPDSGIDPDLLSISSSVTDYLMQIGVAPINLEMFSTNQQRQSEIEDRLDEELNELIYARIEEILGPDPIRHYTPSPSITVFPKVNIKIK